MDRGANLGNLKAGGQRVMWRPITVVAVLILCGCAAQQEAFVRQREAERNAPDLDFQGPLRPATLSKAQIKMVQQGVAGMLKEPASAKFGDSYRGGQGPDRKIVVCGFVNGKSDRFCGGCGVAMVALMPPCVATWSRWMARDRPSLPWAIAAIANSLLRGTTVW